MRDEDGAPFFILHPPAFILPRVAGYGMAGVVTAGSAETQHEAIHALASS